MKRLIFITSLLLMAFVSKCQTPFIGDRLFISAYKQDSMWIRFIGDTILFRGDNGFFKFSKALMVDSIRLKDGKWHKSIVTVESDPIYNAEKSQYLKTEGDPKYYSEKSTILLKADSSSIYGTRYMVGRSIKDSLANLKTRFPILTIKPVRDSLNYELTSSTKPYKIPVNYSIYRPFGAGTITSAKLETKTLTIPVINEGATYSGTDTLTFAGPACPTCVTSYSKTFNLKVSAGKDTVSQLLVLNQYWKIYAVPLQSFYTRYDGVKMVYDDQFLSSMGKSELLINGTAFLKNATPSGLQLLIGLPTEYSGRTIYINGLPIKLTQYPTYNNNFANKRGAAHKYVGLVTASKIKSTILTIEVR